MSKVVDIDEVFHEEYEEYGEVSPFEIYDLDGVTNFDEKDLGQDGWYRTSQITFRYKGKKYSIERTDHVSDNVGDTEFGELYEVEENDFQREVKQYLLKKLDELDHGASEVCLKGVSPLMLEEVIEGFDWSDADTNGWEVDYSLETDKYEISGCMYRGTARISLKQN